MPRKKVELSEETIRQNRERIMEEATIQFQENGFGFTMEDLAKKLGMSKKTIYAYFQDKEELFFSMVDKVFADIKEEETRILNDESLPLVEKIKRIIIVLPERYLSVDYTKLSSMQEKYPQIYQKVTQRIESDWEPTILLMEKAMEQGLIRKISIPVFQCMVEATMEHFLSRSFLKDQNMTYEQGLEELISIMMDGIVLQKK